MRNQENSNRPDKKSLKENFKDFWLNKQFRWIALAFLVMAILTVVQMLLK